jgi:hypothetical protein
VPFEVKSHVDVAEVEALIGVYPRAVRTSPFESVTAPVRVLNEETKTVGIAVDVNALEPSAVVVAVPPFDAGMTPVSENVVLPFVTLDVTLPDPRTFHDNPLQPFRD